VADNHVLTITSMDNEENKDIDLDENNEDEQEAELESEDYESDDTDWKAEALKYKSMARRYKERAKQEAQPEPKEQAPLQTNREERSPILDDEAVDLRLDGYSKDEVSFILRNGGRKALEEKDSYVATAISAKREQQKAEEESSKAKDTSQMVGTTKKYTPEQLAKMSSKELAKILPHTEE
jgi:hypothetical protein